MVDDRNPGCIHPGDPEGCIGGFMLTAVWAICLGVGYLVGVR